MNVSSSLTVRSGPATTYPSVGQLSKGDKVVVDSLANGWAHLMDTSAGTSRYVSAAYLKRLSDYDGKTEPDEPVHDRLVPRKRREQARGARFRVLDREKGRSALRERRGRRGQPCERLGAPDGHLQGNRPLRQRELSRPRA